MSSVRPPDADVRQQRPRWRVATEAAGSAPAGSLGPIQGAGPSPSAKPARDSGSVGFREPGRCVTSTRKSTYTTFRCRAVSTSEHWVLNAANPGSSAPARLVGDKLAVYVTAEASLDGLAVSKCGSGLGKVCGVGAVTVRLAAATVGLLGLEGVELGIPLRALLKCRGGRERGRRCGTGKGGENRESHAILAWP